MINKMLIIIVASLFISSCGPGQFLGPTITPTPTLTPTSTTTPTPTLTPTSTPLPGPIGHWKGDGVEWKVSFDIEPDRNVHNFKFLINDSCTFEVDEITINDDGTFYLILVSSTQEALMNLGQGRLRDNSHIVGTWTSDFSDFAMLCSVFDFPLEGDWEATLEIP